LIHGSDSWESFPHPIYGRSNLSEVRQGILRSCLPELQFSSQAAGYGGNSTAAIYGFRPAGFAFGYFGQVIYPGPVISVVYSGWSVWLGVTGTAARF
jgi:hypothetical protein